jgi:hypothetical protein
MGSLALAGCGNDQAPAPSATNQTSNTADAPGGYLGTLVNAQQRAVKTVDTASISKAIQLFNVEEGRNPKSLQELVDKKLIGEIPPAPNGMKLDYDPATGEVKLVPK